MKTPLSYYGGKQRMLKHILPLIPDHDLYTESFIGGAAVFFAKDPAAVEVINDLNGEIVNFYEVLKTRFDALSELVSRTLHSHDLHRFARIVYFHPRFFDPVRRAWAVWVLSHQSFSSQLNNSWGYGRAATYGGDAITRKMRNKKAMFELDDQMRNSIQQRIERTQIECRDAVKVIETRDCAHAFHYVDPPYFNADMGHYGGYTEADFVRLLECLRGVEGKFLLSCYDSDVLREHANDAGWRVDSVEQNVSASVAGKRTKKRGKKTEMLILNY